MRADLSRYFVFIKKKSFASLEITPGGIFQQQR